MSGEDAAPMADALGDVAPTEMSAAGGSPALRWLLESGAYRKCGSALTLPMGVDCEGRAHVADLKRLPHMLVSGLPWSGKSTFVRAAIATLLLRCPPPELRLFMYSSTPLALRAFEGLPHLLAAPTFDPEEAIAFLEWAHHEMGRRYRILAAAGVRTVDAFNRVAPLLRELEQPAAEGVPRASRLPYVVGVFDGLDGLAGRWNDDLLALTTELCQMSRAIGIHLLMTTADLSLAAWPSRLDVTVPARVSFRQARRFESSIGLGMRGAEELTAAGEALFFAPAAKAPVSLRTPWVGEEAVQRVVVEWQRARMRGRA